MSADLSQFKNLLRELFQFDHADLDFGIYRILNRKREQIETFIQDELVEEISTQVERLNTVETQDVEERFLDAREKVVNTFSEDALGKDDELVEYQETPLGEEYMEVWEEWQEAQAQSESKQQVRRQIYDHLYRFFRRYYDDGDFVTKRRFSAGESKYAIPYNGEEVKLHWASRNQYYVKTSERFTDYRFNTDEYHVHFKLIDADTPTDNSKGDTRYFIPYEGKTITINEGEGEIIIRFEYRPITEDEEEYYLQVYNDLPGKTYKTLNRNRLCEAMESILMDKIEDPDIQSGLAREETDTEKTLLLTHLNRYTARNTADYFIHKDLEGFLKGQLDYFIKSEVLHLDDVLSGASDRALKAARIQADVVRNIGEKIIGLLSQIENFQKNVFEKKKFVLNTDYCITVDKVPDYLYQRILNNKKQIEQWRQIYSIEDWDVSLEWNGSFDEDFLYSHPHIMIDTGNFDTEFKRELISSFDKLENQIDGVLIKGENFQTINTIERKYKSEVDCVYVDPPYNTKGSEIIYKNNYKHSSWISMIKDRLDVLDSVTKENTIICSAIDDAESPYLHTILDEKFGEDRHLATVVVRSKPQGRAVPKGFSPNHEYAIFYSVGDDAEVGSLPRTEEQKERYPHEDEDGIFAWSNLRGTGANSRRVDRPKMYYPIYVEDGEIIIPDMEWDGESWNVERELENAIKILPIDDDGNEKVWSMGNERARKESEKNLEARHVKGRWQIYRKYRPSQDGTQPGTWWGDSKYSASESGTKVLSDLLGHKNFSYPKSIHTVTDCLRASGADPGTTVLDHFAGSGTTAHAVMNLNDEDEGGREYILIDMGEYFDDVLKTRLMKVAFADEWDEGVPKDRNGQTHFFKYQSMESYDDALNNLQLQEPEGLQKKLLYDEMDDYVLRYMLEHETDGSPSLLAEEAFTHPFDYTLQIKQDGESPEPTTVDLVETFHYLIGMTVREYTTAEHQGRRYVSTMGTVETSTGIDEVRCIWRDTEEPEALNLEEESEWAEEKLLSETPPDRIYVNGTTQITGAKPVEIPFRDRMG